MVKIVAKLKDKVLRFLNKIKQPHNSKYIRNKPKDINKKVKNEFGNSSGLWKQNLFIEPIT